MTRSTAHHLASFKPQHVSHQKELVADPDNPFPVGVEYYRPPVPPQEFWDEDFARIRAAGMTIVRTFPYWNWIEPSPGEFRFDDFDHFFELAHRHDLKVWFDTPAEPMAPVPSGSSVSIRTCGSYGRMAAYRNRAPATPHLKV